MFLLVIAENLDKLQSLLNPNIGENPRPQPSQHHGSIALDPHPVPPPPHLIASPPRRRIIPAIARYIIVRLQPCIFVAAPGIAGRCCLAGAVAPGGGGRPGLGLATVGRELVGGGAGGEVGAARGGAR